MMLVGFKRLPDSEKKAILVTMFSEPLLALLPSLVMLQYKDNKTPGAEFPKPYRKLVERYFGDKTDKQ
jgi:hypothetical protein